MFYRLPSLDLLEFSAHVFDYPYNVEGTVTIPIMSKLS